MSRATQDPPDGASWIRGYHPLWRGFPTTSPFAVSLESYNPSVHARWFGLVRFRSPLLAESYPFLGLLRCFSSPGSLPFGYRCMTTGGFPHSDISGSSRLHTPDQSFSQYITSFIGTVRQGIRRLPLSASFLIRSVLPSHVIRRGRCSRRYPLLFLLR